MFTDRRDINSSVRLFLSTKFSKIISFRAGGGYANHYFWPIAVMENVYFYRADISYSPMGWLTVSVGYEHRESDNDSPEGSSAAFRTEYDQNSVTVTLAARF